MEGDRPGILLEVRDRVSEALGRFGIAGEVRVEAGSVILTGHGPTVSVDVSGWLSEWERLPPDMQARRCTDVARSLAEQRRASARPAQARPAGAQWSDALAPLGIGALAVAAVVGLWRIYPDWSKADVPRAAPTEAPSLPESKPRADAPARREARVCDATRSRVMRGATVGPTDVEGWLVELAVLRPSDPSTRAVSFDDVLVAPSPEAAPRVQWSGARILSEKRGDDTRAIVDTEILAGTGGARWDKTRFRFFGQYVKAYFDEDERSDYYRLATFVAERTRAAYAALYARCAHRDSPHVGSWFRGHRPGGATTALLYFMGSSAEVPHLHRSELHPEGNGEVDPVYTIERISKTSAALDKSRASMMLGPHGGMISGDRSGTSIITFPFRDSNRASRASRAMARELGIGTHR